MGEEIQIVKPGDTMYSIPAGGDEASRITTISSQPISDTMYEIPLNSEAGITQVAKDIREYHALSESSAEQRQLLTKYIQEEPNEKPHRKAGAFLTIAAILKGTCVLSFKVTRALTKFIGYMVAQIIIELLDNMDTIGLVLSYVVAIAGAFFYHYGHPHIAEFCGAISFALLLHFKRPKRKGWVSELMEDETPQIKIKVVEKFESIKNTFSGWRI